MPSHLRASLSFFCLFEGKHQHVALQSKYRNEFIPQSSRSSAPIGRDGASRDSRQLRPSPYLITEKSKHRWSGCLGVFTPAALDPQMCAFWPSGCMQHDITLTAHAVALHGRSVLDYTRRLRRFSMLLIPLIPPFIHLLQLQFMDWIGR